MGNFFKGILVIVGLIVGIPAAIVAFSALIGFGALLTVMPEVILGVVAILLIASIPGLIVGLIIGRK